MNRGFVENFVFLQLKSHRVMPAGYVYMYINVKIIYGGIPDILRQPLVFKFCILSFLIFPFAVHFNKYNFRSIYLIGLYDVLRQTIISTRNKWHHTNIGISKNVYFIEKFR